VDIVFEIMHRLLEEDDFDRLVLVTGDGDYIKTVKYLIQKERLKKILFPNNNFSSLYNPIAYNYGVKLSLPEIKKKIEHKKRKCP
jgi:uncharacterized LabA/DUF88 family protein